MWVVWERRQGREARVGRKNGQKVRKVWSGLEWSGCVVA